MVDRDRDARQIASAAGADPVGWFEQLYQAADGGGAVVPWDLGRPSPLVEDWLRQRVAKQVAGSAVVVGAGLGRDAELVGACGWRTIGFDVSGSAVRMTRERFPNSPVDYVVADLLAPPAEWRQSFDLVVENMTVQSLPRSLRVQATAAVADLVGEGGTLLVVAAAAAGTTTAGPPWPLTREDVGRFAVGGLERVRIDLVPDAQDPTVQRWRAEFRRPA